MKFRIWAIIIILGGCKTSSDLSKSGSQSDDPSYELFSAGTEKVTTDEFIYVYKKNNVTNDSAYTKKDIEDYLDLYVKFKLKIAEAKRRGMDTTAAFEREFNTYKDQLKKPYLTESKVTEQLVNEAYERYKNEVRASHILVQLDPEATPEDTVRVYQELIAVREDALNGADFEKLARQHSDDPSVKLNGGDLGYFTSFQMLYPFESAAYNTPEGGVSMPVRTKYGYHLIKVTDKRPSQGSAEVSHIMIRINSNKSDSTEARNKIFEIYDQAVGGVNWEDLVRQYSEDINTKNSGGKLRPFKVGQMPYTFQEAAFSLREPGDISDPVMTPYGWHIIRLERRLPLESFKDLESTIRSKIDRDSRAQLNKKLLIERLKKENGFEEKFAIEQLWAFADSSLILGTWSFDKNNSIIQEPLFIVGDQEYKINDFFQYVEENQRRTTFSPRAYMQSLYGSFMEEKIISHEENHLEDKYIDYRMLVKEYREGILLFELMEQEVWNKAVKDTAGLRAFYNKNIEQYQWAKRVNGTVYTAKDENILSKIEELLNSSDSSEISKKALEERFNNESALTLQIQEGTFERGDHALIDQVEWNTGVFKLEANGMYHLIHIKAVLPPESKPLDNIRGMVISDYQNHLEQVWVKELRAKYPVKINEEGLNYIYEKLEK